MESQDYVCLRCGRIIAEYSIPNDGNTGKKTPRCVCGHRTIHIAVKRDGEDTFAAALRIRKHIPRIKHLNGCRKEVSDHYKKCSAELDRINAEIRDIATEDAEYARELDAILAEIRAVEGKE